VEFKYFIIVNSMITSKDFDPIEMDVVIKIITKTIQDYLTVIAIKKMILIIIIIVITKR